MNGRLNFKKRLVIAASISIILCGGIIIAWIILPKDQFKMVLIKAVLAVGFLDVLVLAWESARKRDRQNRPLSSLEGMVGRSAVVVQELSPDGKVWVGNEIWNAMSSDGRILTVGEKLLFARWKDLGWL